MAGGAASDPPATAKPEQAADRLTNAGAAGISGGAIYDALIAQCALKAKAQFLYTWNVKHFTRLGPEIANRVREP